MVSHWHTECQMIKFVFFSILGCQPGNQLAAFYKFDLEWYEWATGLLESARFAQFGVGTQTSQNQYSSQFTSGTKGGSGFGGVKGGVKGGFASASASSKGQFGGASKFGQAQNQGQSQYSQFSQSSKYSESSSEGASGNSGAGGVGGLNLNFQANLQPFQNSFSSSYSEKKTFQSEPQFVTYTTKPEIVTFTTKPEYFTYTTKPKLVTYTTKPQIITYETSGSGQNPQFAAPDVSFNPTFSAVVGKGHTHNAQCKCLENGKK